MKVLFIYPRFSRHAQHHPELREVVPMNEYLGSPSLGIACMAAVTPPDWEIEYRDDRLEPADAPTDADLVALSFFTPAATRALELADHFRAQGIPVVAGGIFPTMMPEVVAAHVDAVVVGEGEDAWPQVLRDVARGCLQPRYGGVPLDLACRAVPRLSVYFEQEREGFLPDDYPVQISRGCPLSCTACALPTSMHDRIRVHPLDHILAQLDQLDRVGKRACLTEDTSWFPGAGQRRLLELFDVLAEQGRTALVSYIGISMPMLRATKPKTFARAYAAGVRMFYLVGGFDPISINAFTGKDPRALARAEEAIARAHEVGIEPYTSFLLGNDTDDEGTVDRMLEFADRTGIRKAEFAIFTPYPGTPSWHRLLDQGRILHRRWDRYNDANVVFQPANMSPDQLQEGYLRLWREFYASRQHLADLPQDQRTIQF